MGRRAGVTIGSLGAAVALLLLFRARTPDVKPTPTTRKTPATVPTTSPATLPSTTQADDAKPPTDVLSVVRSDDPKYPTERPLDLPVELADAAKIVLKRPAYVDPQGNLWITHPQGRPIKEMLAVPVKDATAVVRETVRYVHWPANGGPGHAVIFDGPISNYLARVSFDEPAVPNMSDDTHPFLTSRDAGFDRAIVITGGLVAPTRTGGIVYSDDLRTERRFDLPRDDHDAAVLAPPAFAYSGSGVWAWSPWQDGKPGSRAVFIDAAGVHLPDAAAGWPDKPIEVIPLADGSVLVVAVEATLEDYLAGRGQVVLKLIPAAEKPPTAALLRTIQPLARQLADADPTKREAAQRAIEAQGPAAYPVLEAIREQLPPEAQVRIESLLGQRFAPTLGGLRPLEGAYKILARFPGGGCAIRLDGGGETLGDDVTPARSVIPAIVLIRPGQLIETLDADSLGDFVPGRNTIQWVGDQLIIGDPKLGPRRFVGNKLVPLLPPDLARFDTVVAIDARRRWLLKSSTRPGEFLLIDPSLPDTTPKLPVWNIAAGAAAGRTDDGWPAVRRGERLFVLQADGWHVEKPDKLRPADPNLPVVFDRAGRMIVAGDGKIEVTDATGRQTHIDLAEADDALIAASPGRVWAYTPDGKVRRYALTPGPTLKLEGTFGQGVPANVTSMWIDPAGRLAMTTGDALAVGFTLGRVPASLSDMMLKVER